MAKIKQRAYERNPQLYGDELDQVALQVFSDYEMNMNAVRSSFKQFIFEYKFKTIRFFCQLGAK
jgi:hypothetical protein